MKKITFEIQVEGPDSISESKVEDAINHKLGELRRNYLEMNIKLGLARWTNCLRTKEK